MGRKMKPLQIDVYMDKKCVECGKKGATNSGICLTCVGKIMTGKPAKSVAGSRLKASFENLKNITPR